MLLKGIVIPCKWSEGIITAIALACDDEREYKINNNSKGEILKNHVNELVTVSGEIIQNSITIHQIEHTQPFN